MRDTFRFSAMLLTVLFTIYGAKAEPKYVGGVHTACAGIHRGYPMPGKDAERAGSDQAPLNPGDSALITKLARDIFGADTATVQQVPTIYFHDTNPNGQQWKDEGIWPTGDIRAQAGKCSWSAPQSLGTKHGTTAGLIEVSCPAGRQPWTNVRLGVEITKGEVSGFCANVGDVANFFRKGAKPDPAPPTGDTARPLVTRWADCIFAHARQRGATVEAITDAAFAACQPQEEAVRQAYLDDMGEANGRNTFELVKRGARERVLRSLGGPTPPVSGPR